MPIEPPSLIMMFRSETTTTWDIPYFLSKSKAFSWSSPYVYGQWNIQWNMIPISMAQTWSCPISMIPMKNITDIHRSLLSVAQRDHKTTTPTTESAIHVASIKAQSTGSSTSHTACGEANWGIGISYIIYHIIIVTVMHVLYTIYNSSNYIYGPAFQPPSAMDMGQP